MIYSYDCIKEAEEKFDEFVTRACHENEDPPSVVCMGRWLLFGCTSAPNTLGFEGYLNAETRETQRYMSCKYVKSES